MAKERVAPAVGTVPDSVLGVVWELACLRAAKVVEVVDEVAIRFQSGSLALPSLLAAWVEHLDEQGTLRARWRIGVAPGPGPVYQLTPECPPSSGDTRADLQMLGRGLQAWVRERAERELEDTTLGSLSPRERVVLVGFLDGWSVRMLARRLFVSRHTVRNQLKSVFLKLDVHSQEELRARFVGRAPPYEVTLERERRATARPTAET